LQSNLNVGGLTVAIGAKLATGALLHAGGPFGSVTINGDFQVNDGGSVTGMAFVYGPNSSLVFANTLTLSVTGSGYIVTPNPAPTVVVQGGGDVNLDATLVVPENLELSSGHLVPQVGPVVLEAGCTITGGSASSHVNGRVQRLIDASVSPVELDFPVGDTTGYAPVSLTLPSVTTGGSIMVETVAGDHASVENSGLLTARSLNRSWSISVLDAVFSPCDAVFNFTPADVDPGADPLQFELRKFAAPDVWTNLTLGARTATSIEALGIASFSDFMVGMPQWTVQTGGGLPAWLYSGGTEWGDYDNDGDLDLLMIGDRGAARTCWILRNDAGAFVNIDAGLPQVGGAATWGDYDNDGDLDVAVAGDEGANFVCRVYRHDVSMGNHTFVDIGAGFPPIRSCVLKWADFDNDGDLDLFLAGVTTVGIMQFWENTGGDTFTQLPTSLPVVIGDPSWGDYDRDGDMDLLTSGSNASGVYRSIVFRNDGGAFTDAMVGLIQVASGSAQWGDYDQDGWLDILLTGAQTAVGPFFTEIYHNNGDGSFTLVPTDLFGMAGNVARWGDYDNDGDLDIVQTGRDGNGLTEIYRNDSGAVFTKINAGLPGVYSGLGAWGDYDNDGDLDILLNGLYGGGGAFCGVILNHTVTPNTPPSAPMALTADFSAGVLTLNWDAASDAETPAPGLTYNVRIGTTLGGDEIFAGMADATSGYRRVVHMGNAGHRLSWSIELGPNPPPLYWSVQAIDAAFAGSPWATKETITAIEDPAPVPLVAALHASAPNPFRSLARVAFDLPHSERVHLGVYDVHGKLVRVLRSEATTAGRHTAFWNGRDQNGRRVGAGVYWVRMRSAGFTQSHRVVLVQ
jgi:hypothetical protein